MGEFVILLSVVNKLFRMYQCIFVSSRKDNLMFVVETSRVWSNWEFASPESNYFHSVFLPNNISMCSEESKTDWSRFLVDSSGGTGTWLISISPVVLSPFL